MADDDFEYKIKWFFDRVEQQQLIEQSQIGGRVDKVIDVSCSTIEQDEDIVTVESKQNNSSFSSNNISHESDSHSTNEDSASNDEKSLLGKRKLTLNKEEISTSTTTTTTTTKRARRDEKSTIDSEGKKI